MRETWYVLEDGSNADPREVAPDKSGVLRHKNGVAVAIGGHGNPRSTGVDVEAERKSPRPEKPEREAKSPHNRQVKAGDDGPVKYKTR